MAEDCITLLQNEINSSGVNLSFEEINALGGELFVEDEDEDKKVD